MFFKNKYIKKFTNVCGVCGLPYDFQLAWGEDWCRHDSGRSTVQRVPGMKMAQSEWDAKSEGILDYDTKKGMQDGSIRTAADLKTFARENGWNQPGEEKLIKKIQQKHGLR